MRVMMMDSNRPRELASLPGCRPSWKRAAATCAICSVVLVSANLGTLHFAMGMGSCDIEWLGWPGPWFAVEYCNVDSMRHVVGVEYILCELYYSAACWCFVFFLIYLLSFVMTSPSSVATRSLVVPP